jgi:hypothetical protein
MMNTDSLSRMLELVAEDTVMRYEHITAKSSNAEDYEVCDDDQTGQDGNVSHQPV